MIGEIERLGTIALIALVFAPLEFLWPAIKRPSFSWQRYRTDLLHVLVGGFLIRFGTALLITWALSFLAIPPIGMSLPLWLQVIMVLVISDLGFYFAHRLFHAVPALWQFHRIHHSSEHLDWLAAYRVHPVDQIFNATIIALPALALGFSPIALLIYAILYQWHAIFLHSNLQVDFGPIGKFIVSPRFHRWHHANEVEAHDRNFGGQLAIWDRLFGTLIEPKREPSRLGVDDPPAEYFVSHLIAPVRRKNG